MKWLQRVGMIAFAIMALLNAWPLFAQPYIVTLDGASHLDSAGIIARLWWGDAPGCMERLFAINTEPLPNWMGHLLLMPTSGLNDKGVLLIIAIGLPLAVFVLARKEKGDIRWLALLALPLAWSFPLLLGFYNFLLSVVLFLVIAAWWSGVNDPGRRQHVWLGALLLLLYFTHSGGWLCCTAWLACKWLVEALPRIRVTSPASEKSALFRSAGGLVLAVLPALLLLASFTLRRETEPQYMEDSQLRQELFELRSLVLFNTDWEAPYNRGYGVLLVAALLIGVVMRVRSLRTGQPLVPGDALLGTALIMLVCYFVLPDNLGYAGYMVVRWQFLCVVCMVVWIASQPVPLKFALPIAAAALVLTGLRTTYLNERFSGYTHRIASVVRAAEKLPHGSVVLPVLHEPDWLLGGAPAWIGVNNNVCLLNNYEAGVPTSYFPLRWREDIPHDIMKYLMRRSACVENLGDHVRTDADLSIDAIVVIGNEVDSSACWWPTLNDVLRDHFLPVYDDGYARSYVRKM